MSPLHILIVSSTTPSKEVQALRRLLHFCGVRSHDVLVLSGDIQHITVPRSQAPKSTLKDEMIYDGRVSEEGIAAEREIAHRMVEEKRAAEPPTPPTPLLSYDEAVRDAQGFDRLDDPEPAPTPEQQAELDKLAKELDERSMQVAYAIMMLTGEVPTVEMVSTDGMTGMTDGELHAVKVTYLYRMADGGSASRTLLHERTPTSKRPNEMVLHALRKAMQAANKDHCPSAAKG